MKPCECDNCHDLRLKEAEYMQDYDEKSLNYQLIEDIIHPIADLVLDEGGPANMREKFRKIVIQVLKEHSIA
jgi:hypothetical protein